MEGLARFQAPQALPSSILEMRKHLCASHRMTLEALSKRFCTGARMVWAPQAPPEIDFVRGPEWFGRPKHPPRSILYGGQSVLGAPSTPRDPPARAPPCFSYTESVWSARPLGRHRVFHNTRKLGTHARSGATVFFRHRERLERSPARAPPCFSHRENA